MSIVWIVLGCLLEFIGVSGLVMVATGGKGYAYLGAYVIFSLLGAGLFVLGSHIKKRQKARQGTQGRQEARQRSECANCDQAPNRNVAIQTKAEPETGEIGLLQMDWKKHLMSNDAAIMIRLNDDPIDLVLFSAETVIAVPLAPGTYRVQTVLGFRKAETTVSITDGRCTHLALDYSRSTGNVRFRALNPQEFFNPDKLEEVSQRFRGRYALMQEALPYICQGFPVRSFSDTKAVVVMNKITNGMLGIDAAVVNAVSVKTILELQSNGLVTSRTDR